MTIRVSPVVTALSVLFGLVAGTIACADTDASTEPSPDPNPLVYFGPPLPEDTDPFAEGFTPPPGGRVQGVGGPRAGDLEPSDLFICADFRNAQAVGIADTFRSPEQLWAIYSHRDLPEDTRILVLWRRSGERIHRHWTNVGGSGSLAARLAAEEADGGFPPGKYEVIVRRKDVNLARRRFTIEGRTSAADPGRDTAATGASDPATRDGQPGGPDASATSEGVLDSGVLRAVLTDSVGEGSEPGKPKSRFSAPTEFVHLFLEAKRTPPGGAITLSWYRGEDLTHKELVDLAEGERCQVSLFSKGGDRLPSGQWRVTIRSGEGDLGTIPFTIGE